MILRPGRCTICGLHKVFLCDLTRLARYVVCLHCDYCTVDQPCVPCQLRAS